MFGFNTAYWTAWRLRTVTLFHNLLWRHGTTAIRGQNRYTTPEAEGLHTKEQHFRSVLSNMAGRIIFELLAISFAANLQTQPVYGCTSTLNCLSYPKLWCCENGRCCSSSEYLSSFNTVSSSECTSNYDCTSSEWCCENGLCCSYSEYLSETNNKDCTIDSDCTSSNHPWCCSNGDCCSISDVINNGVALGISIIVAIIMSVIVLIIVCSVAIACYCRNKNENTEGINLKIPKARIYTTVDPFNTTGVVLTPNTAQSVGMAPYPGPHQGYPNQAYPGQAYKPQPGPPTINQGAV